MKKIILILFSFLLAKVSFGTHIIGGEITYICQGNDLYEIKVKIYRDCYNGVPPLDNPAYFGIYDANNTLVGGSAAAVYWSTDTLLPVVSSDPCLSVPPTICVEEGTYVFTAYLPPSPGGYTIVYQRCCRNNTIANLFDAPNTGATYLAIIPDTSVAICNSSPYFVNYPPIVICAGQPLIFDHSAIDPDGDSLVYQLCTPFTGGDAVNAQPIPPLPPPYAPVTYLGSFTSANPMPGLPPLNIDPVNGLLTITPTAIGQYVVGVCVEEYRNGVLIQSHLRDFQFNVVECTQNVVASIPSEIGSCPTFTVDFPNNSIGGITYHWDFGIVGSTDDTSNLQYPTFSFPSVGQYTITLIVNPGSVCSDTTTAIVTVIDQLVIDAGNDVIICPGEQTQLNVTGGIAGVNYSWTPITGLSSSTIQNPIASPPITITYIASATVGTCFDDDTVTVFVLPFPTVTIGPDQQICPGDSVQISASGATDYLWTPSSTLSDAAISDPYAFPLNTTTYVVAATDSLGCPGTAYDSLIVDVIQITPFEISNDTTIYLGTNAFLFVNGNVLVVWSPGESLNDSLSLNPVATPNQTTTYIVTITTPEGCTYIDSVTVTVVVDPLVIFPNAFSPNGDDFNDIFRPVFLGLLSVDYFRIYNRWGEVIYEGTGDVEKVGWDGMYKGEQQEVGVYVYVFNGTATATGHKITQSGNVTLVR